jgi:hypothetical protein
MKVIAKASVLLAKPGVLKVHLSAIRGFPEQLFVRLPLKCSHRRA